MPHAPGTPTSLVMVHVHALHCSAGCARLGNVATAWQADVRHLRPSTCPSTPHQKHCRLLRPAGAGAAPCDATGPHTAPWHAQEPRTCLSLPCAHANSQACGASYTHHCKGTGTCVAGAGAAQQRLPAAGAPRVPISKLHGTSCSCCWRLLLLPAAVTSVHVAPAACAAVLCGLHHCHVVVRTLGAARATPLDERTRRGPGAQPLALTTTDRRHAADA